MTNLYGMYIYYSIILTLINRVHQSFCAVLSKVDRVLLLDSIGPWYVQISFTFVLLCIGTSDIFAETIVFAASNSISMNIIVTWFHVRHFPMATDRQRISIDE